MEGHCSQPGELQPKLVEIGGISADHTNSAKSSIQTPVPRRQLTRQEQLALKPVVQRLYIEEGLTFAEVQRVLQTKYNFNPTSVTHSNTKIL